jgi:hypothetical protein
MIRYILPFGLFVAAATLMLGAAPVFAQAGCDARMAQAHKAQLAKLSASAKSIRQKIRDKNAAARKIHEQYLQYIGSLAGRAANPRFSKCAVTQLKETVNSARNVTQTANAASSETSPNKPAGTSPTLTVKGVSLLPGTVRLAKNRIIAPLNRIRHGRTVSYSFWVNPLRISQGWTSILHKGRRDQERGPSIFFIPRSTRLHVRISTEKSWNDGCDTKKNLPPRRWSHIVTQFRPGSLEIYINGKLGIRCPIGQQIKVNNGSLFAGSPWHAPAVATINNVQLFPRPISTAQIAKLAKQKPKAGGTGAPPLANIPHIKLFPGTATLRRNNPIAPKEKIRHGSTFGYSFWIRPNGVKPKWSSILHKGGRDNERGPAIFFFPKSTRLHARVSTEKSWNDGCDTKKGLPLHKWSHVFFQARSGFAEIYVNGRLGIRCRIGRQIQLNKGPLLAGNPWYQEANAEIRDVRLYTRALSPAQVAPLARPSS